MHARRTYFLIEASCNCEVGGETAPSLKARATRGLALSTGARLCCAPKACLHSGTAIWPNHDRLEDNAVLEDKPCSTIQVTSSAERPATDRTTSAEERRPLWKVATKRRR